MLKSMLATIPKSIVDHCGKEMYANFVMKMKVLQNGLLKKW
jgi:hypothetical protein